MRPQMTTRQDGTNTPAGEGRPTTDRPGEQRRVPGPGGRGGMPSARTWLWFALILLVNFLILRLLFPGPEAPVEDPPHGTAVLRRPWSGRPFDPKRRRENGRAYRAVAGLVADAPFRLRT